MTSAKPARGLRAAGVEADNSGAVEGVEAAEVVVASEAAEVAVASEAGKAADTSLSPQVHK